MELKDLHNHTRFSFDSETLIDDLCENAIRKGISTVAITNHLDLDCIRKGLYEGYDNEADTADILYAKDKYAGKGLRVMRGIELGQTLSYLDEVEDIKREFKTEIALGSVHNLVGCPDFYYFDFGVMEDRQIGRWFEMYLDEILRTVSEADIDVLTHLGYPIRYIRRAGKELDALNFAKKYEEIFRVMIKRGIALEINTSGLRRATDGETTPSFDIVGLYRSAGGEKVTVGSDAHRAENCGEGISETYEKLVSMGFADINGF